MPFFPVRYAFQNFIEPSANPLFAGTSRLYSLPAAFHPYKVGSMEGTAPVPGYLNCYVTREGHVYNHGKLKVPIIKKDKAPKIRLQENGIAKEHGLATLVALAFVPNPHDFKKVICKDKNNRNCRSDNLAWVSNREYARHSLFPGKPLELVSKKPIPKQPSANHKSAIVHDWKALLPVKIKVSEAVPPAELNALPIPGFPGYYVTLCCKVYSRDRLLTPQQCRNKADRVKVKRSTGILERHTVVWLLATTFIPNPNNHPKVVFIDKIKSNCAVENLRWVSLEDYHCYYRSSPDILSPFKPRKIKTEPVWIDPDRIPVEGFDGYFITPQGIVYKRNRIIKPRVKKGKSLKVSLVIPGSVPIARKHLGLAKLIAQHFVPNPKKHPYIIFKDRNNQHCWKENIAWVDGETFVYYCGIYHKSGTGKIILDRKEAIQLCTNQFIKNYYETLDDYWLEKSWQNVEERLKGVYKWSSFRSDCYMYFMDRVERFSVIKDPVGLLWAYMKGLKAKLRQEVSTDISYRLLMQTDESLRNIDQYANLEE